MEKLNVVKIGGNVIDNESALKQFLEDFSQLEGNKILVHGGGKMASRLSQQMGIEPNMVDGRRITDKETLRVVTMMYAGWVSKSIVAQLQANNCNALGLSGADINLIQSEFRPKKPIDFGFVGDIIGVNGTMLQLLIQNSIVPVCCAITHDKKGNLLNTNADTIAATLAVAASKNFNVSLIYCFEKNGVLSDPEDDNSVIPLIDKLYYQQLIEEKIITAGMLPKMHNCFDALDKGVADVKITHATNLKSINKRTFIGSKLVLKA